MDVEQVEQLCCNFGVDLHIVYNLLAPLFVLKLDGRCYRRIVIDVFEVCVDLLLIVRLIPIHRMRPLRPFHFVPQTRHADRVDEQFVELVFPGLFLVRPLSMHNDRNIEIGR